MQTVFLSSLYLAPIQYYSLIFRAKNAIIEVYDNYQKQSYRNRCVIGGANGPMSLSIPIEKPFTPKCLTKDTKIAEHGNWRHLHWNAIISAYNSSPYFEFYADDFAPFYEQKFKFLFDFNKQLHALICRLLAIENSTNYTTKFITEVSTNELDMRETIHPKRDWRKVVPHFTPTPYYQVFQEKHGFLENLSIIDLLFNMGNEARLYL